MPPKKPVKMALNAFHKGHAVEGESDLPLGPSGAPDDHRGGRWEEDRPPRDRYRDSEGPSRADDGEWRTSGGGRRGGGGFRGGGDYGDREGRGGFRGGDRGDRPSGGFGGGFDRRDRGGEDRGESSRAEGGSGWRRDDSGPPRRDEGGDGGGWRDVGGRGDRFGGDRGGDRFGDRGGDRDRGDRGGDRFGDRGDRFGDRGGDRESGFRRGGDFGSSRGGDRESGDVRASSGYRPLQLKKKGESTEGSAEPARRSDMFSRGDVRAESRDSRESRDSSRSDARGDVRGDAVVIHKSASRGGRAAADEPREGEGSDRESSGKPSKSPREEASKPEKEEREKPSVLERALENKASVSLTELEEGLNKLKITPDNRSQLQVVLARSIYEGTVPLAGAVETLQEKTPSEASSALVTALQQIRQKKGEDKLLGMIEASKVNVLEVIGKDLSTDELDKLLTEKNLLCLKPASALDQHVAKCLNEGKMSADAILEYINKNTESKQSLSTLGTIVGNRVGELLFADAAKPDLEVITQYSKLLKRVVSQPKADPRAMGNVLFGIQNAWSNAKMPKGALKPAFEKLHASKIIAWEGFDHWREDRENKTPNKPKALVQVNSFLDTIQPKKEEEEEDEGDEGDDEEEP